MSSFNTFNALGPMGASLSGTLSGSGSRLPGGLASDVRSLQGLKANAAKDPQSAIKDAARQLEGMFMQELMKSMRSTTLSTGMLDNAGTQMGTDMLDQQFAMQMTGMPRGLGDAIVRQLERQMGASKPADLPMPGDESSGDRVVVRGRGRSNGVNAVDEGGKGSAKPGQLEFIRKHQDAADAAQAQTGIPASFMLAQAAHESGWGKRTINNADGTSSHNVFGIKAGANWNGPVATVTTTEYINGEPRRVQARFRSYSSHEEAFADYARLMKDSPRYSQVVANADSAQGFARGLQKAGYATDPDYADKLGRMINTTLRLQRLTG
jgi:flagellar protein FlgJ